MNEDLIQKIDRRLKELGESRSGASDAAGLGKSYIRDLQRKAGSPNLSSLTKLANYLRLDLDRLLPFANVDSPKVRGVVSLPVVGTIAAGAFMDISIKDQDEVLEYVTVVSDGRFPHAEHYALRVSGDSMNLKYPDGSYVVCADFIESGVDLKNGMAVHVERYEGHLVETTLKEVSFEDGRLILSPRSSNPKYQRIVLEHDDDRSHVKIRGIVTGSFRPEIF